VIDVFDRLAPAFDGVLPFFATMAGGVAALLPLGAGTRVLDLGAGIGAVTGEALARGASVVSVDASAAMIARLHREHPRAGVLGMDAHRLGFLDGCFDVVVAGFVMHLLDDPGVAAAEVARVLVPGGLFAFTIPGAPPGSEPTQAAEPDRWAEFRRYLVPGTWIGKPLDGASLLSDTGFSQISAAPVRVDLPVTGGGKMLWEWYLSHGTAGFIDALPDARREEFRERIIADADAAATGALRITATMWSARTGIMDA
jgi:O-methyltransferase/aklanonic acid methyltransferase